MRQPGVTTPTELKELYARRTDAIAKRPEFGRGGGYTRVRLFDGFACQFELSGRTEILDLPADEGGRGAGPRPDELMRASLGAALAQGYRLWAARLDLPVGEIQIEIVSEHDTRGQLGISDDIAVGWQSLHIAVTVVSPAADADLRAMIALANRRSPLLANLSPAVAQVHDLTVIRPRA